MCFYRGGTYNLWHSIRGGSASCACVYTMSRQYVIQHYAMCTQCTDIIRHDTQHNHNVATSRTTPRLKQCDALCFVFVCVMCCMFNTYYYLIDYFVVLSLLIKLIKRYNYYFFSFFSFYCVHITSIIRLDKCFFDAFISIIFLM